MRISDWSSDVCSSDLNPQKGQREGGNPQPAHVAAEAGVEPPARQRLPAEVIPAAFGDPRRRHAEREQYDQRDDDEGRWCARRDGTRHEPDLQRRENEQRRGGVEGHPAPPPSCPRSEEPTPELQSL